MNKEWVNKWIVKVLGLGGGGAIMLIGLGLIVWSKFE